MHLWAVIFSNEKLILDEHFILIPGKDGTEKETVKADAEINGHT